MQDAIESIRWLTAKTLRARREDAMNKMKEEIERIAEQIEGAAGDAVMIGTKKLSTIRQQIDEALASTGDDPIQRLEQLIASAKRKGDSTEVMEDLKRFLESPRKRKRGKQRVGRGHSRR
jgi:hypothetical protein